MFEVHTYIFHNSKDAPVIYDFELLIFLNQKSQVGAELDSRSSFLSLFF